MEQLSTYLSKYLDFNSIYLNPSKFRKKNGKAGEARFPLDLKGGCDSIYRKAKIKCINFNPLRDRGII